MNPDIYKLREQLEDKDATQSGGLNAILTGLGFSVFTRLNAPESFQTTRPRLELKAEIGTATGRRFVCPDNVLRFDAFNFSLKVQAVTEPQNDAANNEQHEEYCGQIRAAMSGIGGNESLADTLNFPNIYIAEYLRDNGTFDTLKETEGLEYSVLEYAGIVCIRPTAFN
jgi:hypothetical protein